jgi:hypothetical protein
MGVVADMGGCWGVKFQNSNFNFQMGRRFNRECTRMSANEEELGKFIFPVLE